MSSVERRSELSLNELSGITSKRPAFFGYCAALVFFVSVVSGMNSEHKQTSRLVVDGQNMAFAGTYAGQYILIPYDPESLRLNGDSVILMEPNGPIELERKEGIHTNR